MSTNPRERSIDAARPKLGDLADSAHYDGIVTYLTRRKRRVAAIVPVGSTATAAPESAVDAAVEAAFPDPPEGMTSSELRRRMVAALNAAHPHLAELVDAAERRGERRGDRDGYA